MGCIFNFSEGKGGGDGGQTDWSDGEIEDFAEGECHTLKFAR